MRCLIFALAVVIACTLAVSAYSQSIYIWDKDNNHAFPDPEGGGMVSSDYAIRQALTANGFTFTMGTNLPSNLDPYDVLFVIMGVYC